MSFRHVLAVRRSSLKLFRVTFVCFLLCWLCQHELLAQRIVIRMGRGNEGNLETYNQFNNMLEGKRAAAKNRIESQLLDIDRVCELSPKQRTRLEVAGKGAVISSPTRSSRSSKSRLKTLALSSNGEIHLKKILTKKTMKISIVR